jgi:hypothetical protein
MSAQEMGYAVMHYPLVIERGRLSASIIAAEKPLPQEKTQLFWKPSRFDADSFYESHYQAVGLVT